MIEGTKEKLKNIGSGQYFMNFLILVFEFGSVRVAKDMNGNYYINYMITAVVFAIYLAYYKIYLINIICNEQNKRITKRMFLNITICNYIILIIMNRLAEFLSKFLYSNTVMPWILFIIGYFILSILNIIIAPSEYTFFEKDYMFFEGIIIGVKLLNEKKKDLIINNIKILGTHFLNIITLKIFTIKSSGLIYGINYNSII